MLMNADQIAVVLVLACALGLFIWGRWRYDLVALAALIVLTLMGIIPAADAFTGFGHPAVITVASVMIIGRALHHSGVIEALARRVARVTRHPSRQVLLLTGAVAICSAFMNNVAALALLMPVAIHSAEVANRPISQVLMPLSFASLLGGLITLMGTPPNIIIASFRAEAAGAPFAVFDFTKVGLPVAVIGILFIAFAGWRLIPLRHQKSINSECLFEISDYVSEAQILSDSPLIGQSLGQFIEHSKIDIRVVALIRQGYSILAPELSVPLQEGDVIILEGAPQLLQAIAAEGALEIIAGEKITASRLETEDTALVEAIISPGSRLEHRQASRVRFRRLHGANLLAVSRQGRALWRGLRDLTLRVGDVLLLHGRKDSLPAVLSDLGCLPLAQRKLSPARTRPDLLPLGLFGIGIATPALGFVPVQVAFAATALLVVALGRLPIRDLYSGIDWPVIILIGAMLPVGASLERSGATELFAHIVLEFARDWPLVLLLALLIAASMLLSDVINNAAAAIVMAPFAGTFARDLGLSADGFLMAVAMGTSCTFLTPIGHQSNTLVMSPGGYRFGDYWRLGLPLNLITIVIASILILFVWA